MTTVMNKIKTMFGFGRTDETGSGPSPEDAQAADPASTFLANQAKDRAAKLQEVQDKATQGRVE